MATAHDLTPPQYDHASRLLDAFKPAKIVEDVVWDVCLDVASQLPDAAMDRLVQAAELASARREQVRRLESERFPTQTTTIQGMTRG